MDRALKERIIGAIVLVAFAVLVVPVFLDGPHQGVRTVSEPVILPGQNEQPRKTTTIVLERDRSEPLPQPARSADKDMTADDQAIVASEKTQLASSAPPVQKDMAAPVSKANSDPSAAMWAVQLGSFSNQENAENLAADLRGQGYAAFLSQSGSGTDALHRVRIGPQKDRDSAESVARRLQTAGHSGQVVPYP